MWADSMPYSVNTFKCHLSTSIANYHLMKICVILHSSDTQGQLSKSLTNMATIAPLVLRTKAVFGNL